MRIAGHKREKASTMVFAAMFTVLCTLAAGSYMTVVSSSSVGTARIADQQRAYYGAEAGAYRLMAEMNSSGATSVSDTLNASNYQGAYTAAYNNTDTITSTGTVNGMSSTVSVKVFSIPASVRAALTVNGDMRARGRLTLDGRTYDAKGKVVSQDGAFGVSAAGKVRQNGSSKIGGNGYAPARPAHKDSFEQKVDRFASTKPWDLLGVSESWFNMNVPLRKGLPPAGYKGIWYTATPPTRSADVTMQGILIVHNAGNNAALKMRHGTFKGLIIADRVKKITGNAKVYGAMVLTAQKTRAVGSGTALIAYCPQVLSALRALMPGSNAQWKTTMQAGTWQQGSGQSVSPQEDNAYDRAQQKNNIR